MTPPDNNDPAEKFKMFVSFFFNNLDLTLIVLNTFTLCNSLTNEANFVP